MGATCNAYGDTSIKFAKFWSESLNAGEKLEDLMVDGRVIFKLILTNRILWYELQLFGKDMHCNIDILYVKMYFQRM
jgi:hypothetical protein